MEQSALPIDFTNPRDLLALVFKHKFKVLIAWLVVFVIATVVSFGIRPSYEAKAVLLIKIGREFQQRPDGVSGGPAIPLDTIMRGEVSILRSQEVTRNVVNSVGIYNIYPGLSKVALGEFSIEQSAMKLFEQNLSVSTTGSSLMEIAFTHSNPFVAAKVVNTLVEVFKDRHLEVFGSNSTEFLESQQKVFQERLKESEQKLASFRERSRIYSPDEQRAALIGQRSALDTSLKAAQSQISELQQKTAFVRSARWTVDVPQDIRTQLTAQQQREREALQRYNDTSNIVQNIRQEIQALQNSINKYVEELREIELRRVEGELTVVKARADSLIHQMGQIESELRKLDASGREFQDLRREAGQQEQNYQTYAKKLEESLIMDDMDRRKMVAISVVERATASPFPKKQRMGRRQIVVAGFFGGIAAGIALALLLELLSPGMTTPMSAEKRLGLPVMVAIARKG